LFSVEERDRAHAFVLALADEDPRVVAGAIVGSTAIGPGDRLSDLDLTFAVADDASVADVLADWTRTVEDELGALQLFDLPSGPSIYRVFLLPGCLQFDLSFTPASSFGAVGPKFRLLFGEAVERAFAEPPPELELFGYGVHHALRARIYLERGRLWHAEYWVSATRDYTLLLACRKRGLPATQGRGFDDLPEDVLGPLEDALPRSLERGELLRALRVAVDVLLREGRDVPDLRRLVEADTLS
jgi:hypothetical protein